LVIVICNLFVIWCLFFGAYTIIKQLLGQTFLIN